MEADIIAWLATFLVVVVISIFIVSFYYYIDEFEPEDPSDLIITVFIGIITTVPVIFIFGYFPDIDTLVFTTVIGPIIEEGMKGGVLLLLVKRDNVDGPIDGFIYGAMLGVGFSIGENFLYGISTFYHTGSILSGITIAGIRSLLSIIGHPLYSGLVGLALAKYKIRARESILDELGLALLSHCVWNFVIQIENPPTRIALTSTTVIILLLILYHKLIDGLHFDQFAFSQGYYSKKEIPTQHGDDPSSLEYPVEESELDEG